MRKWLDLYNVGFGRCGRLSVAVIAGTLLVLAAGSAMAAATGEFLFVQNVGAGQGGIWGVDVTGTNFFGVRGAGFRLWHRRATLSEPRHLGVQPGQE
jgi:hypothetical protein